MKLTDSIVNMIKSDRPSDILYADLPVWEGVFPEIKKAKRVTQRNKQTVIQHTYNVLNGIRKKNTVTIVSAITHDLGKVNTRRIDTDGRISFCGHHFESAMIVKNRLPEIGFNQDVLDAVIRIVRNHMYDIKDMHVASSIRRFIAEVGEANLDNWFELRTADSYAYLPDEVVISPSDYNNTIISPFKKRIEKVLAEDPLQYTYEDIMPK